ncbi:MAG: hypothetical protein LKM31_00040 [Sphingobium sp.]|jgi:hypothetical protein|nr:hypothetical protein [Sphingobium sp.]
MKLIARLIAIEVGSMPPMISIGAGIRCLARGRPGRNAVKAALMPVKTPLATAILVPIDDRSTIPCRP